MSTKKLSTHHRQCLHVVPSPLVSLTATENLNSEHTYLQKPKSTQCRYRTVPIYVVKPHPILYIYCTVNAPSPKASRTPSPRTPQSLRSPSNSVSTPDVREIFPQLNSRLASKRRNSIHLAELVERELKSTPKQLGQLTGLLAEKRGFDAFEEFLQKEFAAGIFFMLLMFFNFS